MSQNIKKILLIFLGIIVAFFAMEAALRLSGMVLVKQFPSRQAKKFYSKPENTIRIVCLGDSHTYGMNLEEDDSYPGQLSKIFQKNSLKKKVEVFNLAYPDFTSRQILRKFQALYPQLSPDIAVVMAGRSDRWHVLETNNAQLIGRLNNFFSELKTVKLLNILSENIRAKTEIFISERELLSYEELLDWGRREKIAGNYKQSLKLFYRAFKRRPESREVFVELDDLLIRWNNPKETVAFYTQMFNFRPGDELIREKLAGAYVALADNDFYKGNFSGTIQCYENAFALEPGKKRIYSGLLYNQAIQKVLGARKTNAVRPFRQETIENLKRLAQICRKEKIILLFSQYPEEHFAPMEIAAREYGLPVVEHSQVFSELLKQFPREDFFYPDGHCKAEGNRVVAENIEQAIRKIIDCLR